MGCCDDPTEPSKIDPRELIREHDCMDAGGTTPGTGEVESRLEQRSRAMQGAIAEERYGNLVRDLFTDDPEKVILKQLNEANTYLRELAALRAHYDSVRKHAIELLGKASAPAHAPYLHPCRQRQRLRA